MFRFLVGSTVIGSALADSLPVINVALAPPADPLPSVTALSTALENRRAEVEASGMKKIQAAFDEALSRARPLIAAALGRGAFLKGSTDQVVRVKAANGPGTPRAVLSEIAKVEKYRENVEKSIIATAAAEFDAITDVVLRELGAASRGSFLKASPAAEGLRQELNVRVAPGSHSYPTVAELVKLMQYKRDLSEDALRARVLNLESQFIQALNGEIASALGHSFLKGAAPTMDDMQSVADNSKAAANAYLDAASSEPSMSELGDRMDALNAQEMASLSSGSGAAGASGAQCIRDYSATCPSGYTETDGLCVSMNGNDSCESAGYFGNYSVDSKIAYEARCNVAWPCKSGSFLKKVSPLGAVFRPLINRSIPVTDNDGDTDMRKTQAPMVWFHFKKAGSTPSFNGQTHEEWSQARLGELAA